MAGRRTDPGRSIDSKATRLASSLFVLIDDIASTLDDVATMTKVAAGKTAGVLGDDLALNAQQVSGVSADRELPVVWAVAKGSLVNKAILVPAALAISAFAPWAVAPLLMAGGAYLCFEGVEKLAHRGAPEETAARAVSAAPAPALDLDAVRAHERERVRGAVRTDFILSAEIIVITLGTVAQAPLPEQVGVLCLIAVVMTVGVYGVVAGIVKIDDLGLWLSRRPGDGSAVGAFRSVGRGLLRGAPWMMKGLSVAGTVAMFLVGGGILTHGVPVVHDRIRSAAASVAEASPFAAGAVGAVLPSVLDALAGAVVGAVVLAVVSLVQRVRA